MFQYDLNEVYIGETKQDVFKKNHKDKYIDTNRNILSQEITTCIVEALIFIFL